MNAKSKTSYIINVTTGTLVVTYTTGSVSNNRPITEPTEIKVPGAGVLTFTLNGDTANITRI